MVGAARIRSADAVIMASPGYADVARARYVVDPTVVSNFGSMGRICDEQGVGVTCEPTDPQALAAAVTRLRDPAFYEQCRANTPAMAAISRGRA